MMWWWNNYSGPMPWAFGPLMMIVVVALCAAIIFFMMRGMTGGHRSGSDGRLALDILKERFARGEISQAEYEERRRLIET
jgi:putative membrane protein